MKIVLLVFVTVFSVLFGFGAFYQAVKEKKERKQTEKKYENMIKAKEEDDKQKEELQTKITHHSNHTDNVLESLDLLHNNNNRTK